MHGTILIEVGYKKDVADPVGSGLERDIAHLHLGRVKDVRAAQLYRLVGDIDAPTRERIGRDLLTDPVVQEYKEGDWRQASAMPQTKLNSKGSSPVVIDVWYKSGVTDVVGESVLKGIRDLSIDHVEEVRTGARYRLAGLPLGSAEKIALALLANPLVNDYVIHAE